MITGPAVTSSEVRPLYSLGQSHNWLGAAVSILVVGQVIWLSRLKERTWLRRLAWAALGATIVQDLVGIEASPLTAPVRIFHALLGQLLFSTTVAIAVFALKGWSQTPKPVENRSFPRFLVVATPALVLLQVALGTAFRHGVIGALPHLFGALVFATFLGPTMAVILRIQHREVRRVGIALTLCASLQMIIGFALLTMESMDIDPLTLIVTTTAHAAMGAFTLAAAAATAIQIHRVIWSPVGETGKGPSLRSSQDVRSHESGT
jgi:heme A synthase